MLRCMAAVATRRVVMKNLCPPSKLLVTTLTRSCLMPVRWDNSYIEMNMQNASDQLEHISSCINDIQRVRLQAALSHLQEVGSKSYDTTLELSAQLKGERKKVKVLLNQQPDASTSRLTDSPTEFPPTEGEATSCPSWKKPHALWVILVSDPTNL